MAYNISDLVYIGTDMWRDGAIVKATDVDGIYKCTTNGHGGYLVDVVKHPELKDYGFPTLNKQINAFEEDYEALKVDWLYPSIIENKKWYESITIEDIVYYETDDKFKNQFPNKRRNRTK